MQLMHQNAFDGWALPGAGGEFPVS